MLSTHDHGLFQKHATLKKNPPARPPAARLRTRGRATGRMGEERCMLNLKVGAGMNAVLVLQCCINIAVRYWYCSTVLLQYCISAAVL